MGDRTEEERRRLGIDGWQRVEEWVNTSERSRASDLGKACGHDISLTHFRQCALSSGRGDKAESYGSWLYVFDAVGTIWWRFGGWN